MKCLYFEVASNTGLYVANQTLCRIWAVSAEQHAQCIKILDSASVYLSGFPNVFTVDNYSRVKRNLSVKLMNGFKGTYR